MSDPLFVHWEQDGFLLHALAQPRIATFRGRTRKSIDDARLLNRVSGKGEPTSTLDRRDPHEWIEEHISLGYTTHRAVIEACWREALHAACPAAVPKVPSVPVAGQPPV